MQLCTFSVGQRQSLRGLRIPYTSHSTVWRSSRCVCFQIILSALELTLLMSGILPIAHISRQSDLRSTVITLQPRSLSTLNWCDNTCCEEQGGKIVLNRSTNNALQAVKNSVTERDICCSWWYSCFSLPVHTCSIPAYKFP